MPGEGLEVMASAKKDSQDGFWQIDDLYVDPYVSR